MARNPDTIIVGAGPAGLACAAMMKAQGLDVAVLEKADRVGAVWRRHYDRLHLHTDRKHSGLPGMAMPRTYPHYPSREQLIEYLESYAVRFDIAPIFNSTVSCIRRDGSQWRAETAQGSIHAPVMVVATGIADAPYRGSRPGSDSAARSSGLSDPGMGHFVPALARASGRCDQRADLAARCRSNRKTGIAPRRQGTAANGRRGRARTPDRYRHAGQNQRRLDPNMRRH